MKRFYAAVSVIVFILALSALDMITVIKCADSMLSDIYEIEKYAGIGDFEQAYILSENFEEKYKKYEVLFSVALHDEKTDNLFLSAAKISPLIEKHSDEYRAELKSISIELERIKNSEIPYWYNII